MDSFPDVSFRLVFHTKPVSEDVRVYDPGVWDDRMRFSVPSEDAPWEFCLYCFCDGLWYGRHEEWQSLCTTVCRSHSSSENSNTFSHCTETVKGSESDHRAILALEQRFGDGYFEPG